jgi:hypothetical protein
MGWVRTDQSTTAPHTLLQFSTTTTMNAFTAQFVDGKAKVTVLGTSYWSPAGITITAATARGVWTFVVFQFNGATGSWSLREEGVTRFMTTTAAASFSASGCLAVGHLSTGSCTASGYSGAFSESEAWNGQLREVRFWVAVP